MYVDDPNLSESLRPKGGGEGDLFFRDAAGTRWGSLHRDRSTTWT